MLSEKSTNKSLKSTDNIFNLTVSLYMIVKNSAGTYKVTINSDKLISATL